MSLGLPVRSRVTEVESVEGLVEEDNTIELIPVALTMVSGL